MKALLVGDQFDEVRENSYFGGDVVVAQRIPRMLGVSDMPIPESPTVTDREMFIFVWCVPTIGGYKHIFTEDVGEWPKILRKFLSTRRYSYGPTTIL